MIVCVHVGKTGGVHVHRVLREGGVDHVWLGHCTPLILAAETHPADRLLIGIREPVQHALSAFDARLRKQADWSPDENKFFARFPNAQEWCDALGSPEADAAFEFLGHVSLGLAHYFAGDYRSVLNRTWIYDTHTLSSCMRVMFDRIGLDVPIDNERQHNAAPSRPSVSHEARRRLCKQLVNDIEIYHELQPLTLTNQGAQ